LTLNPAPTTGQVIYVITRGGISVTGGSANNAIGLMTVAGIEGSSLAPVANTVNVSELTTVASTAALKNYIHFVDCTTIANNNQTGTCVSIPGALDLDNMAATVTNLVNAGNGRASDFLVAHSQTT